MNFLNFFEFVASKFSNAFGISGFFSFDESTNNKKTI